MKIIQYNPSFCEELLRFFDGPPFSVSEVQKKDGSVTLLETAAELPTFAAFAKKIGATCAQLRAWENKHTEFKYACEQARDRQGDILLQNSLRGNYSASFAAFTAKHLLGWNDGKDEPASTGPVVLEWGETSNEPR